MRLWDYENNIVVKFDVSNKILQPTLVFMIAEVWQQSRVEVQVVNMITGCPSLSGAREMSFYFKPMMQSKIIHSLQKLRTMSS